MLKKMNSFYQMLLVVISLFSFNSLQAAEDVYATAFSFNGKITETAVVKTPENWTEVENVKEPFRYKFIHESGDCEAYLAFSCYTTRPDKDTIFLTVKCMEELYGENFLKLASDLFYDSKDDSAFFHFDMPKGDKIEHVVVFSYLGDANKNCIVTFVCVYKDWNSDKLVSYGHDMIKSVRFITH